MAKEFVAYFDDSGHPSDQPFVVVAGFVSSEDEWTIFHREWKRDLRKIGKQVLHPTDFQADRSISQEDKDEFTFRLADTIARRSDSFICAGADMRAYREINEKYAFEEFVGSPYALVGRTVAADLNYWRKQYLVSAEHLLTIFEDGSQHKGDLMEAMARDGLPSPTFLKKECHSGLQAACMASWEVFTFLKQHVGNRGRRRLREYKPTDIRRPLRIFVNLSFLREGIYYRSDLLEMCQKAKVPLRSQLSPNVRIAFRSSPKRPRRRTILEPRTGHK